MTKSVNHIILVACCVLFSSTAGFAQDFGSWNTLGFAYKQSEKLLFDLKGEWRLDQNFKRTEQYFFALGGRYDFSNVIRVGAEYRYAVVAKDNDQGNRIGVDLEFRKLGEKLLSSKRLKMEGRFRTTYSSFEYTRPETFLRGRLTFGYDIPKNKLKPEISAELFYRVNDQLIYAADRIYGVNRFTKLRLRAGLSYDLEHHGFNAFYQFQQSLGGSSHNQVIGLAYAYTISGK